MICEVLPQEKIQGDGTFMMLGVGVDEDKVTSRH